MFGTSGAASGHNPSLLPASSVSPPSSSPLFHLPAFVSQSADRSPSSPIFLPSSVIVPPQPKQFHHQMGTSPSTTSSLEANFDANPLMSNLIASLATLSRPHPPIVTQSSFNQNGFPLITDVFQNSLTECLRHSSSTPNVKTELPFHSPMDNASKGSTTNAMPNANLLNMSLSTDHLRFAQYSSVSQKSPSSIELLQRALEAFAVANQSKFANSLAHSAPSIVGSPLIPPPLAHSQSQQLATNGATAAATTMSSVEQQLLSLLNFSQLSSKNGNTLCSFTPHNLLSSNGFCLSSATITATTTTAPTTVSEATQQNNAIVDKANEQTDEALANSASAAADPSVPIDLSSNQQQSLLLSSAPNLALPSVPQGRKSCDIRRSASSVSYKGNADVHEHFQRTFSGKWPRRQPSLRAHLQASGRASVGKKEAALCIGENEAEGSGTVRTEEPMEEEEEEGESAARNGAERTNAGGKTGEKGRPKSRQQVKSVYTAVIRKLFTSNEVNQVEDHFRKSLGEDRFLQIKNEQQRKKREEQSEDGGTISRL
ncbi:hypothetical protein niasHS_012015 [Heterodera schachtii]|uniref:Uncharacterized protein n=1 Tax=Heterodera schachtii TaxID=97005 RepID=A0ABD2IE00_HETSC